MRSRPLSTRAPLVEPVGRRRGRRRRGPRRARRDRRARRRGPPRDPRRPGERGEPRRPGVLVVRRAVPRRLPRAAPHGHPRLRRPGLAGLAGDRRLRPGRRPDEPRGPAGRADGPGRTSSSPPARSAPGCAGLGVRFFPVVGWAERGGGLADGPGNSVPRFHIVWGTGPGVVAPFERRVREHAAAGRVRLAFRHRVDGLGVTGGVVDGVHGALLAPDGADRGRPTSREVDRRVRVRGAGRRRDLGRHRRRPRPRPGELARAARPAAGGPAHRRPGLRRRADARHRRGGRREPGQLATGCGTTPRASPTTTPSGPATASASFPGRRRCGSTRPGAGCPSRCSPASTPSARSTHLGRTGHEHTWFVTTQRIVEKEFALSGSEQNPDLTGKDVRGVLGRARAGVPAAGAGIPGPWRGLRGPPTRSPTSSPG